ncbi:Kinesin light chain 3, partial [Xylographa carneopallida]|nr:Kinesin light chain 3 [Xylographa carneopallida]
GISTLGAEILHTSLREPTFDLPILEQQAAMSMSTSEESEWIHRQVLALLAKMLGEEHLDTISAMDNLAITSGDSDQLDEAIYVTRQVLEKQRQILGDENLATI